MASPTTRTPAGLVVNGDVARRMTGRRDDGEAHDAVTSTDGLDRARRGDVRDVRGSSEDDGVRSALEGPGQPDPVIRVLMRHDDGSDCRPVEADRHQPTLDHVRHAPLSGVYDCRLAAPDEDVARRRRPRCVPSAVGPAGSSGPWTGAEVTPSVHQNASISSRLPCTSAGRRRPTAAARRSRPGRASCQPDDR